MPKESLKDKVEGNELDLSLSELAVIPVKELAALPKATHLDFSCNLLTSVPADFCRLQHIVKLDLSKNSLTSLPDNFGQLQKLKHLDLFANQLTSLPVSFCHLKNLKWLDLKDNPLTEPLNTIAGDCLDSNQCQKCAVSVISYMKKVESELERIKQKRLAEEREQEAAKKAEEKKEIERVRAEKKAAKLKRKLQIEAEKAARAAAQREESADSEEVESSCNELKANGVHQHKQKERSGWSCCGVFISFIFGLIVIAVGLYFYCETRKDDKMCHACREVLTDYYVITRRYVNRTVEQIKQYLDKK